MATKSELFVSVRKLRDTLYDRLDDNVTNNVFSSLKLRHITALTQARREIDETSLPDPSPLYDPVILQLDQASNAVQIATSTGQAEMLTALLRVSLALKSVKQLP